MALSLRITLDDTKADFPTAYGRITDVLVALSAGTNVTLSWFVSGTVAHDGAQPIRVDQVPVSSELLVTPNPDFVVALQKALQAGSILTPMDALQTALYLLVQQTPAYSGAIDV